MHPELEADMRRFEQRRQEQVARRRLWMARLAFMAYWWFICLSGIPLLLLKPGSELAVIIGWGFTVPALGIGIVWGAIRFARWADNDLD